MAKKKKKKKKMTKKERAMRFVETIPEAMTVTPPKKKKR